MNDMNKISIYNKVAAVTNSSPKLGEQLKRMAAFIFALSAFTLITSCTEDDLVTQTTPLAPQGMKTVTVDFQLPEGKPAFGEGESRATTTDGTWAKGDELMMTFAVRNINEEIPGGTVDISSASVYLTLVHDGAAWDVNEAKSYSVTAMGGAITAKPYAQQPLLAASQDLALTSLTLMLDENFGEVDECFVQVFYAPDVERVVGDDGTQTLQLKATATTTAPEMWQAVAVGDTGSLDLQWMDNNQARLRVRTGTAGDVVTLTSEKFYPNSIGKSADGIYTATTDADGNAYFYGEAGTIDDSDRITATTSGFNLSLTAVGVGEGDAAFTYHIAPVTLLEASTLVPVQLEAGKSYRLVATEKRTAVTNTIAVIDGTCGNISTGTDENVAAVKAAIAGKSTVIVTGETLAAYINTSANTVVGEAIRQLETSTTFSIVLPAATSIGEKAFNGCRALTSVSLPAAETIGYYAFQECTSLTSVSAPKATSIREYAFSSCTALTSVSAPVATTIRPKAFQECTALTSVELPAATSIRDYAFNGCSALTSVELPAATSIGYYAFQECTALASVSLPKVTTIGGNAFTNCTALTSLTFGEVITKVGTKAFDGTLADGTTAWTTQCDLTLGAGSIEDPEAGENEKWAGYTWKSITLVNSN